MAFAPPYTPRPRLISNKLKIPPSKMSPLAIYHPSRFAGLAQTSTTLRAFATATPTAPAVGTPAEGWTLSLERGIGKAYGAEAELQATRAFRAEVFPDLPIATTWQNLGKALVGGLAASATAAPAPAFTHYTTRPGALKVTTIAANLRTERDIEQRILQACMAAGAGGGGAGAGGAEAG
ncbi:hypothetical protein Agub_g10716, partial [Astrephomene gubernaculifera]